MIGNGELKIACHGWVLTIAITMTITIVIEWVVFSYFLVTWVVLICENHELFFTLMDDPKPGKFLKGRAINGVWSWHHARYSK